MSGSGPVDLRPVHAVASSAWTAFGVALLGEHFTPQLVFAGAAVLGGIALVILSRRKTTATDSTTLTAA